MTAAVRSIRTLEDDEYLLIERDAFERSELLDGVMWNMSGASEAHMTITGNMFIIARVALRGTGCKIFATEMKVNSAAGRMFAYPDLAIVCGERRYRDDKKDVLLNPVALIEVLSPSTQRFDRGDKFDRYKHLETLREYVLVSQSEAKIERFTLQADGSWESQVVIGLEASIAIHSVDFPLAEVYEDVFT